MPPSSAVRYAFRIGSELSSRRQCVQHLKLDFSYGFFLFISFFYSSLIMVSLLFSGVLKPAAQLYTLQ